MVRETFEGPGSLAMVGSPVGAPGADCSGALSHISLDRDDANQVAELFKVLGDPTRILIVQALIDAGGLCVHQLAQVVGMSQSSVSHHLRVLRTSGLIRHERVGKEVRYSPDDEHVEQLIGVCVEHVLHRRYGPEGTTGREETHA
ncbi:MAG: metalloregulator ArsR/SmtB family transcription factor [Thermoleophilia bacterium]|nr:metalloregulator ArsR/SmtB family transcription factor [Thermoleophilia bacterium]